MRGKRGIAAVSACRPVIACGYADWHPVPLWRGGDPAVVRAFRAHHKHGEGFWVLRQPCAVDDFEETLQEHMCTKNADFCCWPLLLFLPTWVCALLWYANDCITLANDARALNISGNPPALPGGYDIGKGITHSGNGSICATGYRAFPPIIGGISEPITHQND